MNLNRLRKQIDGIDLKLLRLLNRRASLAVRVGLLKKEKGLPVFDGRREKTILRRLVRTNAGPLSWAAVGKIFREILRQCRSLQLK